MTCRFCLWPSICQKSPNFLKQVSKFIVMPIYRKYHKEAVLLGQPGHKTIFLKIFTSIVYIPQVFQTHSGEKFTGPLINRTDRQTSIHTFLVFPPRPPSVNALCTHFRVKSWSVRAPPDRFSASLSSEEVQTKTQGTDHRNIQDRIVTTTAGTGNSSL